MIFDFLEGFIIECALIITAAGLQNAFILRQGIKKEFVIAVAITCAICESILVTIGIGGMGALLTAKPTLSNIVTILGIVFLILFALKSLYTAIRSNEVLDVNKADVKAKTLSQVILTAIAFCWLNPHVILDLTVMGAFSVQYYPHQWVFALGVYAAAFTWFLFLGILGKFLAKPLSSPRTWKGVNVVIAILCLYMAFNFIHDYDKPHSHDHNHGINLFNDDHHHGHDHDH